MAEENSTEVKRSVNSAVETAGKVGNFLIKDVAIPLATGLTSKIPELATKLPKITQALNFLSATRPKEEKKDNSWKWVLIGIAGFFLLPILVITTIPAAFIGGVEKITGLTPIDVVPGIPAQITPAPLHCTDIRHQAEEVICWLQNGFKQNSAACPQIFEKVCIDPKQQVPGCVKEYSIIGRCLLASTIPNKEGVDFEFVKSIAEASGPSEPGVVSPTPDPYIGKLQCVGFAKAVERSLFHDIEDCGNANDFWRQDCPTNYNRIVPTSASELLHGDIAVRTTGKYGHIGIVVDIIGNIKIVIAQAWGTTGEVFLSEDAITNYQGFLRYKY